MTKKSIKSIVGRLLWVLVGASVMLPGVVDAGENDIRVAVFRANKGKNEVPADGIHAALKDASGITSEYIYELNSATLAKVDVLIFCGGAYSGALASDWKWMDTVREWVEAGHGLLVTHDAVGYRNMKSFYPGISKGADNPFSNRDPFSKECCVARVHPLTEGFQLKGRFFLSYYDYVTIDHGKEGVVVVRGVEKTDAGAVSSAPVVVCGTPGKGRYVANGMALAILAPSGIIKPIGGELRFLLNSIRWLAGVEAKGIKIGEDIGQGILLGPKESEHVDKQILQYREKNRALRGISTTAIRMPHVFSDHMVLQRERSAPVWGWANPGKKVTVEFAGQCKEGVAGSDGRWEIRLDPMAARNQGEVLRISVASTNVLELKDVVVGEVWVCSGQSNMEMPLRDAGNAREDIANADLPGLRFLNVALVHSSLPQEDIETSLPWTPCSAKTAAKCTAAGFYFGRRLQSELGVPIGLIHASWGGSPIRSWTPMEAFETIPRLTGEIGYYRREIQKHRKSLPDGMDALEKWIKDARKSIADDADLPAEPVWPRYPGDYRWPAVMYNAMVYPLIPYAIRGAIWYQGEADAWHRDDQYYHNMRALIGGWRQAWAQGDFPFYYVQLPNYMSNTNGPCGGDNWAILQECQFKALAITNTGMAVTIDIGEADNIHPLNKFDVGERLANWALARDYGQTNVVVSGPLYRELKIEDNRIRLSFDYSVGGLMAGRKSGREPVREMEGDKLQSFAVAGEDRKWVWADAIIDGDTVLVSSPNVPKPVAVRYAYSTNPEGCNLYNVSGLPASPFRTDVW